MRQKGIVLIELLGAMAVGSLVMVGALAVIYQVVWGTSRANSQVTSLVDVDQAALAVKRDMAMTQTTDLIDGDSVPRSSISGNWTDRTMFGTGNQTHSIAYALSGTNLLRTYDGTASIVGRRITSLGFTRSGRVITVLITATSARALPRSETLRFSVYTRRDDLPQ